MPLILRKDFSHSRLAVWHITETADELLNLLPLHVEEASLRTPIKNELLFKQRLSSRLLVHQLLNCQPLVLVKDGPKRTVLQSPSLPLSISHAGDYAAVVIGEQGVVVGVDIEVIHPRIQKIASRFMHESEWKQLEHNEDFKTLMLIWSIKEAVFKLAGAEGLDFKTQIRCHPFSLAAQGVVQVELRLPHAIQALEANYEYSNDTVCVAVIG